MTRSSTPRRRGRPAGFTLVEILVVFLIIALLIGILLPAISAAVRNAQSARVSAEMTQLAAAFADFKAKYGEYPPSRILLCENGWYGTADPTPISLAGNNGNEADMTLGQLAQRSVTALRRYWPRMLLSTTNLFATAAGSNSVLAANDSTFYDFNGNGNMDSPYILEGPECLVFFLGGVPATNAASLSMTGWSKNPNNPFDNGPSRQLPYFEFNISRLSYLHGPPGLAPIPFIAVGASPHSTVSPLIPAYVDPLGVVPVTSSETLNFYAYFSSYGNNGYDPNDCNVAEVDVNNRALGLEFSGAPSVSRYRAPTPYATSPGPNPYTTTTTSLVPGTVRPTYLNPQSFQIISAGHDGLYGWGGQFSPTATTTTLPLDPNYKGVYLPSTNDATIRFRERDNITNLKAGTLD